MNIIQKKIDNKHIDSFFYDDVIAETKNFYLIATGETSLYCDDEPINDEEVQEYFDQNLFCSNNWFEIVNQDDPEAFELDNLFVGTYDEGIKLLQEVQDNWDNNEYKDKEINLD